VFSLTEIITRSQSRDGSSPLLTFYGVDVFRPLTLRPIEFPPGAIYHVPIGATPPCLGLHRPGAKHAFELSACFSQPTVLMVVHVRHHGPNITDALGRGIRLMQPDRGDVTGCNTRSFANRGSTATELTVPRLPGRYKHCWTMKAILSLWSATTSHTPTSISCVAASFSWRFGDYTGTPATVSAATPRCARNSCYRTPRCPPGHSLGPAGGPAQYDDHLAWQASEGPSCSRPRGIRLHCSKFWAWSESFKHAWSHVSFVGRDHARFVRSSKRPRCAAGMDANTWPAAP